MTKKGKSFVDNLSPAMQFLSPTPAEQEDPSPEPEVPEEAPHDAPPRQAVADSRPEAPPKEYKVNPLYVEKKTRRTQLVFRPSLYGRIKRKAKRDKVSVNECIHAMLEAQLEKDGY